MTAELFAAVYAAPEDDAPRAVLADALQRRGDPHGELIALQLAAATDPKITRRAHALVAKYAAKITPPAIYRALAATSVSFERGFPATGMLAARAVADEQRAIGAVEWATIHTLDLGMFTRFDPRGEKQARTLALLSHPAMRHLARVETSVDGVTAIVDHGVTMPWRALAVASPRGNAERALIAALARGAAIFPRLEHLALRISPDSFAALVRAAPWLAELERVTLAGVASRVSTAAARRLGADLTIVRSLDGVFGPR